MPSYTLSIQGDKAHQNRACNNILDRKLLHVFYDDFKSASIRKYMSMYLKLDQNPVLDRRSQCFHTGQCLARSHNARDHPSKATIKWSEVHIAMVGIFLYVTKAWPQSYQIDYVHECSHLGGQNRMSGCCGISLRMQRGGNLFNLWDIRFEEDIPFAISCFFFVCVCVSEIQATKLCEIS